MTRPATRTRAPRPRSSTPLAEPLLASTPERLAAVAARDRAADGHFVFAVRTTGIYCKPSCPSRRPLPANVALYATPAAAERAGFRACRRCRPRVAALADPIVDAVAAACRTLDAAAERVPLASLARAAGYSDAHFHRAFVARTGMTPAAYARAALARNAQRAQAAVTLRYATTRTPLGVLAVAASARGIAAIALGDDAAATMRDLRRAWPRATFTRDEAGLAAVLAAVAASLDDPARALDLPLDIRGTAFQRRVWHALRALPPGMTTTYGALAASFAMPGAARAVASACAANVLAFAIPCHRVVAGDGTLAGYRWGVGRKRALLDRERAVVGAVSGTRGGGG
ncbi:MAG: methylated-DNA--[protein]-cysteine S-methyltransferase [Proteobacteria bacterium]|nr:methylated-DNA--[protein]-cysteine S-methyltransferase [Pseudomonadota bacterium]